MPVSGAWRKEHETGPSHPVTDHAGKPQRTPRSLQRRPREIAHCARFLHAEDRVHDVPQHHPHRNPATGPAPYIYTPEEVAPMLMLAKLPRPR